MAAYGREEKIGRKKDGKRTGREEGMGKGWEGIGKKEKRKKGGKGERQEVSTMRKREKGVGGNTLLLYWGRSFNGNNEQLKTQHL